MRWNMMPSHGVHMSNWWCNVYQYAVDMDAEASVDAEVDMCLMIGRWRVAKPVHERTRTSQSTYTHPYIHTSTSHINIHIRIHIRIHIHIIVTNSHLCQSISMLSSIAMIWYMCLFCSYQELSGASATDYKAKVSLYCLYVFTKTVKLRCSIPFLICVYYWLLYKTIQELLCCPHVYTVCICETLSTHIHVCCVCVEITNLTCIWETMYVCVCFVCLRDS